MRVGGGGGDVGVSVRLACPLVSKLRSLDLRNGTNSIPSQLYHTSTDWPRFQDLWGLTSPGLSRIFITPACLNSEVNEGEFGCYQVYRR